MRIKYILLLFSVFSTSILFAREGPAGGNGGGNQIQERRAVTFSALPSIITIPSSSNIDLYFVSNLGIVDVVVKNKKQQIVCRKLVDTSVNDTLQLDLRNLSSGDYNLIISNRRGFVLKDEKFLVE